MSEKPDRNLGLELVRATEAAALAAARWVGMGQKESGDRAAVDAMRVLLRTVRMDGTIVIGEGEKDNAPMLFNGESVGNGSGPQVDVAVDPVEGTNLLAKGVHNSLAVLAVSERGTMYQPGPAFYMDKLVVGPTASGKVDLDASVAENLHAIAGAKGMRMEEITVVILDRARNAQKIAAVREAGARVRLITDGDVAPALMTALPGTGVNALMGIGGTPEGVATACAMRGFGGEIQARLAPQSDAERKRVMKAGLDLDGKFSTEKMVGGNDHYFAATGITEGDFLRGVRYTRDGAVTTSVVTRSRSGTWRMVESHHRWEKLRQISDIPY
ncbi:MAG TPA: class II fructose-bisphosphatase [Anaerolineales bacterium]|nr:class II fructose-bisphosphatase [Anaerolineales bacterium]HJN42129.1 class II fructose-bisphosphatase [Anaerolineales bacterium]